MYCERFDTAQCSTILTGFVVDGGVVDQAVGAYWWDLACMDISLRVVKLPSRSDRVQELNIASNDTAVCICLVILLVGK
jgi:hypothetical protein